MFEVLRVPSVQIIVLQVLFFERTQFTRTIYVHVRYAYLYMHFVPSQAVMVVVGKHNLPCCSFRCNYLLTLAPVDL
jgi:hypothetical protein